MPGIDLSQPLLGAGASAKTDYAAAQARTGLELQAVGKFKRGIQVELGIRAFAEASAALTKFISATIEGTAFAEARAAAQLQLPLNLFNEFGFSARAEAIAQAAAGIEVDIGLLIGDFIDLVRQDDEFGGLPLELLILFLEEVNISGGFEVNVSASAKAHASISVSGSIIERGGDKAGFYYTMDAGVGLAAGVGMGFRAGAEFKDFRRFYGRAVDKTVDETIRQIVNYLPSGLTVRNSEALEGWLQIFRPVAKTALRIAYDVGLKIAENNPGKSSIDAKLLCNEAVKVFLEEVQRFAFEKLLEFALDTARILFEADSINQPGVWNNAQAQRDALADQLQAMPPEPFQDTDENLAYWRTLLNRLIDLHSQLNNNPGLLRTFSIVYAASELLLEAVRSKVNTASAYAMAVGAGTASTSNQPFTGSPENQPDASLLQIIKTTGGNVSYHDLIVFLTDDVLITELLQVMPEVKNFFTVFQTHFGLASDDLIKMFIRNVEAFDPAGGVPDPEVLLRKIVQGINEFTDQIFRDQILPQVLQHVTDPTLRLYIDEVLFGAVLYMKDVGVNSLLTWQNNTFDNEDFTESLAGVIMLLLGRTVVITADAFLAGAQQEFRRHCNSAAVNVRNGSNEIAGFDLPQDDDVRDFFADCLEIGGNVIGPFSPQTRKRIRTLLYQVFEPIPPSQGRDFLAKLGDDFFIPNQTQLNELTGELATIAKERFIAFAQQFIVKIGEYVLQEVIEFIEDIVDLILNWERHLAETLLGLAEILHNIEGILRDLNAQLITIVTAANDALHGVFRALGNQSLRAQIKSAIKQKFVDEAFAVLEYIPVYSILSTDQKATARGLVNGAVNGLLDNPIINPIFDAINAIADELDDLLPDVRQIDPDANFPEQLLQLIIAKIRLKIAEYFGGDKPHISPSINFSFQVLVYDPPFSGHYETVNIHIPLGRLEIDLDGFLDIVSSAIEAIDDFHSRLNDAAIELGHVIAKEFELSAQELLYEQNSEKQNRLKKIDEENNEDPKEIVIISPVELSHFTGDIDVKVHLGGVPMSYLGLDKDQTQRVLIFINSHLVPMKSLIVEESLSETGSGRLQFDYDYRNLQLVSGEGGKMKNMYSEKTSIIQNRKAKILTNTSAQFEQQSAMKNKSASKVEILNNSPLKSAKKTEATMAVPVKSGQPVELIKTVSGGKKGAITTYGLDNPARLIPGGRLLNNFLNDRIPGLLLQFRIDLNEEFINEGVNVLTVIVISKGGSRHQQSVNFTVSPALPKGKGVGIITIPGVNGKPDVTSRITLNNIVEAYVRRNGKGMDKEAKEKFTEHFDREKKELKTAQVKKVSRQIATPILRHETVLVMDKKGTEQSKHVLKYRNNAERLERLDQLSLSSSTLSQQGLRLHTASVGYETSMQMQKEDGSENVIYTVFTRNISKEKIWVTDEKGGSKSIEIEYCDREERKRLLDNYGRNRRIRSAGIISIEEITIRDGKSSRTVLFEPRHYLNDLEEMKHTDVGMMRKSLRLKTLQKELQELSGVYGENVLKAMTAVQSDEELRIKYLMKPSRTEIRQRKESALNYLQKQDELNFTDKKIK